MAFSILNSYFRMFINIISANSWPTFGFRNLKFLQLGDSPLVLVSAPSGFRLCVPSPQNVLWTKKCSEEISKDDEEEFWGDGTQRRKPEGAETDQERPLSGNVVRKGCRMFVFCFWKYHCHMVWNEMITSENKLKPVSSTQETPACCDIELGLVITIARTRNCRFGILLR